MPTIAAHSGYLMDDYTVGYLRNHRSYTSHCGNPECRYSDCLRDENGYNYDGYNEDGYDQDGYDQDGEDASGNTRCDNGSCDCWGCNDDRSDDRLRNYSYTPRLTFNGECPPWFGMELEVTADNVSRVIDVVERHAPSLIYCKEDGSVAGAELVTHPMSYPWAMQHFPWGMLSELRQDTDATVIGSDNGIHIHVSRDGFANSAHMFRWLKFFYRNPGDIQRIARRRADHWGPFDSRHRSAQRHHVKYGKPGYDRQADRTNRDRYAAINTTNEDTLEVRVFASTLRPQRAQAALQLVAGSVEYTRQLTAEAITRRHGWEWPAFIAWAGKAGDYSALMSENRIRRPV